MSIKNIRKLYEYIVNLLFPIQCLNCQKPDTMFCIDCLSLVRPPMPIEDKNVIAVMSYKDKNIKRALWLLKFHNRKIVADAFGLRLYEEIVAELADRAIFENFINPILIPIPLSKKRLRGRGYNQAELLSIAIASHSQGEIKVDNKALFKIKETDRQAMIHEKNKRLKNLSGCFKANSNNVRGKNIILIDDITTTGATILEARRALKSAGARKVLAITVAH